MASSSTNAPVSARKKRGAARVAGIVVSAVLAVASVALIVAAQTVLPKFDQIINSYFGVEQSWSNDGIDTSGLDLTYNKADYDMGSIGDAEKALDQDISGEGYVLLKNDAGADGKASLPLAQGTTLSFVGGNSRSLGEHGKTMLESTLGLEGDTSDALTPAMESAGFSVNSTLMEFYTSGKGKDYVMGSGSVSYGDDEDFSINECPLGVMRDAGVLDSLEGTTPVFVLKRVAGEGRDMPRSMYNHATSEEDKAKSYLEPDSTELEILQYLNDNFDNTVLVVNSNAAIELDWLGQFPNIRSVLVVPSTGTYGAESLGRILAGQVNPSGRTVDTYAADASASPAAQNFGDYQYLDEDGNLTKYNYVSYEEGIYVGYRYYETRYEDVVLGQGNAGDFDYDAEVCYPFGYGLSYTTFEWSGFSTGWSGKTCTATVTVTNTGDVAGRDVVELYAQSPYTDYDRANGVEKSAVQLVGYAKTKLLEPGESQTVTIMFDESQLAAYDRNGAKTYILDAGTYYVCAAADAHAAANNVLAAKGADVDGDASLVETYVPANTDVDATTYATDSLTGVDVTNQLDDAAGDVTYLTRSDWAGTFPTHDGQVTSQVSTWGNEINGDDGVSYTYGKTASAELLAKLDSTDSGNPDVTAWDGELVYGADNGLSLIDLRGLAYDDGKWDDLLDQLTAEDYNLMIARAGYGTEYLASVDKPAGTDADSTSGWSWGGTGMTFCNPMTVAQAWNQEIAYRLGNMIGNESLLGGATGWYAPAMNIHRTPYSGRNGEYFSEDPFLSGAMASQEVKGAAEKGVYTMMKHFAFNDQENHRGDRDGQYSMATWLNEQAARELYLKPFEMCMKVGVVELNYFKQNDDGSYENATTTISACQGLMTAFNRVGATWVGGSYNLITGIVRTEWGFDGWIITDNADTGVFMDAEQMIEAGADAKLTTKDQSDWWSFDATDAVSYRYAREALHHLLYTMVNGHAMNGAMHGSTFSAGGAGGMQKADVLRWILTGAGALILAIIVAANVACELRRRKRSC
ncbi:MAG: glycoside hydrolase family 3 N-terminal domain-containing protein [Coriobacteriia bacterium]|nr:glycoside hydrolase family 3 N-terminal domain-containing protein [Coriobacteriia bacterium]